MSASVGWQTVEGHYIECRKDDKNLKARVFISSHKILPVSPKKSGLVRKGKKRLDSFPTFSYITSLTALKPWLHNSAKQDISYCVKIPREVLGMKKAVWTVLLMVLLWVVSFATTWAEEKKVDKKAEPAQETLAKMDDKEKAEYTRKVNLFVQVVAMAETQKDPLILITAIKLFDDLPFDGIVKPGQDAKTGAKFNRADLLKEAKTYAAGDEELLAVIAKVETPPEKTAVRHGGFGPPGPPPPPGFGGPHGPSPPPWGYYDRPHHRRHFGCVWVPVCRHGYCESVCR